MPVLQQVPANDYVANGSVVSFAYSFQVLSTSDLQVYVGGVRVMSGFTVSGIGNAGGGAVVFAVAPADGLPVRLIRATTINRTTDYVEGGYVPAETLDTDLDRLVMMVQEVAEGNLILAGDGLYDAENRRIKNLAVPVNPQDAVTKAYVDTTLPAAIASTAASAADSQASADDSAASAAASALSANNASVSQSAAALAAAAAAASAASVLWNDVEFKTFADSPINVTAADSGKLFAIDTTGGNVVVNLPLIAGMTLPRTFGFKKTDATANTLTINRAGTDTIDGAALKLITAAEAGATFIPDKDTNPDEWTTADFGPAAGNLSDENFTAGVHFTAGVTTSLTLTGSYSSKTNLWVYFDGLRQESTEYQLLGSILTFTSAIPVGVQKVFVKGGNVLPIGTPADNTVSTTKLVDGSVTSQKLTASITLPGSLNVDSENLADGSTPAYRFLKKTVLTSSATHNFNPKTKYWEVEIVGAGGAGGGSIGISAAGASDAGSGGGSGAYCYFESTTPISSAAFTAGTPGVGVTSTDGTSGGTSTFIGTGVNLTVPGGSGGERSGSSASSLVTAAGCSNSVAPTGGLINFSGAGGNVGIRDSTGGTGFAIGGAGASSKYGAGGQARVQPGIGSTTGSTANGFGSGGGGAAGAVAGGTAPARAGGMGAPAICIIKEYV